MSPGCPPSDNNNNNYFFRFHQNMIKFEDLKGTNGVAPNSVFRRCENPIDQLGGFALVAPLHDRAHRFCGGFLLSLVTILYCAGNDLI